MLGRNRSSAQWAKRPSFSALIRPGVNLAGDVRDLQGDVVGMGPARSQSQEVAQRPRGREQRV